MIEVGKEVGAKQKLRTFVQLGKKDRISRNSNPSKTFEPRLCSP